MRTRIDLSAVPSPEIAEIEAEALGRPAAIEEPPAPGRYRVLVTSTLAFTLMFAVWMQFGILGIPIQKEFGLSDTAFYWLTALPVLNGAIWRLGTGILADRWGGRIVMAVMLVMAAVPTFLLAGTHSPGALFVLAFLIGFAGNSFSSGIAWNSAWFPRSQQGFALGVFGAGNVGASVTKLIGPAIIAATAGATYFGFVAGGWRLMPVIYAVALVQGIIGLFFNPAESALLPLLVGEERLITANALNSLNDNLGMLTGPAEASHELPDRASLTSACGG